MGSHEVVNGFVSHSRLNRFLLPNKRRLHSASVMTSFQVRKVQCIEEPGSAQGVGLQRIQLTCRVRHAARFRGDTSVFFVKQHCAGQSNE